VPELIQLPVETKPYTCPSRLSRRVVTLPQPAVYRTFVIDV
jgi:hypothetical protein